MGEDQNQPQPSRSQGQPVPPPTPPSKLGSEEAALHETAGTGITMPDWAESLDQDAAAPQPPVTVDLVQRMQQEEAERAARQEAERQAAEATTPTDTIGSGPPLGSPPPPPPPPRKIPKLPSALAAAAVVLLGGFIGTRLQSGGPAEPDGSPTQVPIAEGTPATVPAEPPSQPADNKPTTYKVKPGDTLDSIAEQVGRTPQEISRANGASGYLIRPQPGQVINIP